MYLNVSSVTLISIYTIIVVCSLVLIRPTCSTVNAILAHLDARHVANWDVQYVLKDFISMMENV